jgi:RNA polymerase sigma-70 factor (ECF subfamily)
MTGDELACTQLVTDYQRMVYQLALHLLETPRKRSTSRRKSSCASSRMLPQFRGQSTLRTWIYRIVVTQASNRQRWWRRRRRALQVALDEHVRRARRAAESRASAMPDRALQQRETAGRVYAASTGLPFEQRVAIVLREIDGMRYEEIALALGVAVGTVKSRLARARLSLRDALRER